MDILPLFFDIDEFCQMCEPFWNRHLLAADAKKRQRQRTLCLSEVMMLLVLFDTCGYRNLKQCYLEFVCRHLRGVSTSGQLFALR